MRQADEHRRAGRAGLVAALQRLASFHQREGARGRNAQGFQHRRGEHLANAALQRQPAVAVARPRRAARTLGGEVEQPAAGRLRLPQLGEQEATAVAEVGVVNAELMAVIAHRQRPRLVVRQGFEPGEMRQPLRGGQGIESHAGRRSFIAETKPCGGKRRRPHGIGELGAKRGEARLRAIGGRGRHGRDMAARRPRGKGRFSPTSRRCYAARAMARRLTHAFLDTQSGAGLALAGAGLAALVLANSPAADDYFAFIRQSVPIELGGFAETRTLAQWVKDGLMAVFLLLVGMEIKFELLRGELAGARRLALPLGAAVGGLAGPAIAYWAVAGGSGFAAAVWPAGASTDLAFALAVLALAGPKLPAAARVFILAVAIVDDLASVGLVGAMSIGGLDGEALASAALGFLGVLALGRWRRAPYLFYVAGFIFVWAATLRSGLNPAFAGIACALAVPVGERRPGRESVLADFIASLHPWVAWGVLPLYAFTAAGVPLIGLARPGLARAPAARPARRPAGRQTRRGVRRRLPGGGSQAWPPPSGPRLERDRRPGPDHRRRLHRQPLRRHPGPGRRAGRRADPGAPGGDRRLPRRSAPGRGGDRRRSAARRSPGGPYPPFSRSLRGPRSGGAAKRQTYAACAASPITALTSRYSAKPKSPHSRPLPLIL